MCAIRLPRVLVRKKHKLLQAAALAPVVETGECEDTVRTWELQLRLVLEPIVMYMPLVRADTLVSQAWSFVDKL